MRRLVQVLVALGLSSLAVVTCQPPVDPGRPVEETVVAVVPVPDAAETSETTETTRESVRLARHVLVVGDSEACAVSTHVTGVARSAGDDADFVCKSSTTVQYWSAGPLTRALDARPHVDTVVVFLGTNHYLDAIAPPVGPILEEFRSRGLTCVWVGNTPVMGKPWKVNGLLRDAVSGSCTYFDTEAFGPVLRDGVHPTPASARLWLDAVWRVIPQKFE